MSSYPFAVTDRLVSFHYQVIFHCLNIPHFTYPPTVGHKACFRIIMNKIGYQHSYTSLFMSMFSFLLGRYLRVKLLDQRYTKLSNWFPKWLYSFISHWECMKSSNSSTSPVFAIVSPVNWDLYRFTYFGYFIYIWNHTIYDLLYTAFFHST